MENHSEVTNRQLGIFLQHWMRERSSDEILLIDGNRIIVSDGNNVQEVPMHQLVGKSQTMLEKCIYDLQKKGVDTIPIPDYLGQLDEQRLTTLLQLAQQPLFQQRKSYYRLEVLYYLGEVLTLRGWQKEDSQRIREMFKTNKGASDFKKMARRVYELFQARGIASLYVVEFIRPYHLAQMEEKEFYNELLPIARQLYEQETLIN
jgi:hypothetical protein